MPSFLHKLLEFFRDDARHTKGTFARTHLGRPTASDSDDACCWCLEGGIRYIKDKNCVDEREVKVARAKLDARASELGFDNFVKFNDDPRTTPKQVRALIKSAINS